MRIAKLPTGSGEKKMNPFKFALIFVLVWVPLSTQAQQADELTIASWGGSYEEAQFAAYFEPFEKSHNVQINLKPYNGGITDLELPENPEETIWDVIDLTESDALAACDSGLLAEFDESLLAPSPDGTPARDDFSDGSVFKCGIAHLSYATVLAFDDRAFPNEKPNSVEDFFDIERFPGKRALKSEPKAILEWVMLSYNVPVTQIYDLLSTERGLKLVTQRLNQLKGNIVWWESGQEPVELLRDGQVVMASGFNGRFFEARANQNIPISMIQDGQFLEYGVWGIHRAAPRPDLAEKFVAFATTTQRMADMSSRLPYGPTRKSALERIGLRVTANVSMTEHLSMTETQSNRRIRADSRWYSRTETVRQRWFDEWRNKAN